MKVWQALNLLKGTNATLEQIKQWSYMNRILPCELEEGLELDYPMPIELTRLQQEICARVGLGRCYPECLNLYFDSEIVIPSLIDIVGIPAITVWQPWASLIACEEKHFETRGWATKYRGPIAIHAAAIKPATVLKKIFPLGEWSYAPDYMAKRMLLQAIGGAFEDYAPIEDVPGYLAELPLGAVIATAELVGCWQTGYSETIGPCIYRKEDAVAINETERLFGNFEPGRYAWELTNVRMLPKPIPAKGQQGIWRWRPDAAVGGVVAV